MGGATFKFGPGLLFSSVASQQNARKPVTNAAAANGDYQRADTRQTRAARGIYYGVLISVPIWAVIVGSIYLVCHMID